MNPNWNIETIAVQGGYTPDNSDPRISPICQSTTYRYSTVEEAAALFDLKATGHMYSRISNPTVAVLEEKAALLEGGVGAVALSSGQSATMISILNIASSGQHVLAANKLYGGTHALFKNTLSKMGIEVTFVDQNASEDEIAKHIRKETRCIFAEVLSNPTTDVLDIEKFARIANKADLPLIVDNTFPTPYLCRPIDFGAHIVVHSSSKYFDGHATSVGGLIIDSGNFNWDNGKYPELTTPDESYHGVVYTKDFGKAAYITKARTHLVRDIGNLMAPMNAFLTNLGMETLHLRMQAHSSNALALAQHLQNHPNVEWVKYPGLKTDTNNTLAQKYLPKGCSGVFTFGVKGGKEASIKFMNKLELAAIVVHVADARTSVLHPASMTHRQLTDAELLKAGVTPDLVRVSVGIENVKDIIADFEQALK